MGVSKSKTSAKSTKELVRIHDDENHSPTTIEDAWPSNTISQVTPVVSGPPTVIVADLKPQKIPIISPKKTPIRERQSENKTPEK